MKGNHGSCSGRLPQADIGDCAAAAENTDPALAAPRVSGNAVEDVAAVADLQNMRSQSVCTLSSYDDRRLGLVFRSGRAAAGPASHDVARASVDAAAEVQTMVLAGVLALVDVVFGIMMGLLLLLLLLGSLELVQVILPVELVNVARS